MGEGEGDGMEIMVRAERHDELLDKEEELIETQETLRVVSERRDEADRRLVEKDAEIASLQREVEHRLDEMNLQARWTREAEEKVKRLRAALKPFAEFAKAYLPVATSLDFPSSMILSLIHTHDGPVTVTLDDYGAALKALEET